MANDEHVQILKRGTEEWNRWRSKHSSVLPNLEGADITHKPRDKTLSHYYSSGISLEGANLEDVNLANSNLTLANLRGADLCRANLRHAALVEADLTAAYLRGSLLDEADLSYADLTSTDLSSATLSGAIFRDANLSNVKLDLAVLSGTIFVGVDLRNTRGLDNVVHQGPCAIDISTIYRSEGMISERFLRGCGIPDEFISQIPALVASVQAIQFYSCFISYSNKDEEFARRLHERMRASGLRVWFAPEDIRGGDKLYEQIDRAIQVHDRLLLVLSESSLQSEWVMTELRRARKAEVKESRRKLFPIRLIDYDVLKEWECFDADTGKDLAVEVREYFIPDFSNWKNHDDFEKGFARLLADLKAES